jgi:hypothetical protein
VAAHRFDITQEHRELIVSTKDLDNVRDRRSTTIQYIPTDKNMKPSQQRHTFSGSADLGGLEHNHDRLSFSLESVIGSSIANEEEDHAYRPVDLNPGITNQTPNAMIIDISDVVDNGFAIGFIGFDTLPL